MCTDEPAREGTSAWWKASLTAPEGRLGALAPAAISRIIVSISAWMSLRPHGSETFFESESEGCIS